MLSIVLNVLLTFLLFNSCQGLQCVDHNNNPVDWYTIYKLPQEKHNNPLITQGAAYTYITSVDEDDWKLSSVSINDTNSLVALNLKTVFSNTSDVFYIVYNDEQPDGSVNFKKGHTKGLLLGDKNGGIWLIHSVPHFPSMDNGQYLYPHSGLVYGQSFLCVSLDTDNLDAVGTSLKYNLPNIYSKSMPSALEGVFPKLTDVVNNNVQKTPPWYYMQMLKSLNGLRFITFAKGPKFAKELYADWVAPTLNVNLLTETWLNGPGRIPSKCNLPFKVNNIESVFIDAANCTFKDSNDHSKWAVTPTDNINAKWLCIGDINRAAGQRRRGGGTVCFSVDKTVEAYQKSVTTIEGC